MATIPAAVVAPIDPALLLALEALRVELDMRHDDRGSALARTLVSHVRDKATRPMVAAQARERKVGRS